MSKFVHVMIKVKWVTGQNLLSWVGAFGRGTTHWRIRGVPPARTAPTGSISFVFAYVFAEKCTRRLQRVPVVPVPLLNLMSMVSAPGAYIRGNTVNMISTEHQWTIKLKLPATTVYSIPCFYDGGNCSIYCACRFIKIFLNVSINDERLKKSVS